MAGLGWTISSLIIERDSERDEDGIGKNETDEDFKPRYDENLEAIKNKKPAEGAAETPTLQSQDQELTEEEKQQMGIQDDTDQKPAENTQNNDTDSETD